MDVDLSRVPEKIVDASILKQLMGKKPYIRVQFGIETIIGAAEVRFRCCKWSLCTLGESYKEADQI